MDILIIKMSALGDVVHALPVVPTIRRAYPGARIHWLVEEMAEPVVRCLPGVDEVHVSRRRIWVKDSKNPSRWPKVIGEIGAFVKQLRQQRYDLAIDLQGLLKSGIWLSLVSAKRKLGYDGTREWSYLFLNEKIPPGSPDIHAVDRYLLLLKAAGFPTCEVDFGISVRPEARTRLRTLLRTKGWKNSNAYAVLVPTARWKTKEWDGTSFAALADMVRGELGLQVAVAGVAQDRPAVEQITQRMKQPAVNLAGETDLLTLMALLENARVVISTDSGPMHLAVALRTPVVAIFGPTAPWRTGPYGQGHRVIRSSVSCSPCFKRHCSHMSCMERITPSEVIEAVRAVIVEGARSKVHDPECQVLGYETTAGLEI